MLAQIQDNTHKAYVAPQSYVTPRSTSLFRALFAQIAQSSAESKWRLAT